MNWKSKPKPKSYRFVLCCAVPQHLFCACISSCFYHSSKRDPAREGRSVERGGQSRRCNRHRPIFHSVLPCRSCPGCTAASCRLTHGPGQTDRDRQTRLPKCQESKSECPFLSFSFLSIFRSFTESFSPYGSTIDSLSAPPICETEFAIVSTSRASTQYLTVQPHSPS